VSGLTTVETHPGVVVVGSDLASVALRGLHGVLVVVRFELGSGAWEPVACDWVLYCMGAWNLDMGCPKLLCLWERSCC
jgi:hypothetical protein